MKVDAVILVLTYLLIQVLANKIISTSKIGRFTWLSFSGGVAVSYVFIYILPSMHKEQKVFSKDASFAIESELYVLGLCGLLLFFGIHKAAVRSLHQHAHGEGKFFWIQMAFFSIYNMLVSYIVFATSMEGPKALYYGTAVGLHFMAVSHDLWREDSKRYESVGRYLLAAGIFAGWLLGLFVSLPNEVLSIVFAFIAGAMIFNVLKKELPSEENTHFKTFFFSALGYALLTLSLKYFFDW